MFDIGARIDAEGKFEVKEFGRNVKVVSIDGSKEVVLSLRDDGGNIFISVALSKVRSEYEQEKYRSIWKTLRIKQ